MSVDTNDEKVKDECLNVLAEHLKKKGAYFGVGYNPNEIDLDSIGDA